MPVERCTVGGVRGWRWGKAGKCYTGSDGRERATAQGRAARASGYGKADPGRGSATGGVSDTLGADVDATTLHRRRKKAKKVPAKKAATPKNGATTKVDTGSLAAGGKVQPQVGGPGGAPARDPFHIPPVSEVKVELIDLDSIGGLKKAIEEDGTTGVWEGLEKGIRPMFGSPGGKRALAGKIVKLFPDHEVYVEPFVGGGAVFFAKEAADKEAIGDVEDDIAHAYAFAKELTAAQQKALDKLPKKADAATFKALQKATPKGDAERFHRFLYLTKFGFGGFGPKARSVSKLRVTEGGTLDSVLKRLAAVRTRLKDVEVFHGDFAKLAKKHDGAGTLHFFDPPYEGTTWEGPVPAFDDVLKVAKGLKGRVVLTYAGTPKVIKALKAAGFRVQAVKVTRVSSTVDDGRQVAIGREIVATSWDSRKKVDPKAISKAERSGAALIAEAQAVARSVARHAVGFALDFAEAHGDDLTDREKHFLRELPGLYVGLHSQLAEIKLRKAEHGPVGVTMDVFAHAAAGLGSLARQIIPKLPQPKKMDDGYQPKHRATYTLERAVEAGTLLMGLVGRFEGEGSPETKAKGKKTVKVDVEGGKLTPASVALLKEAGLVIAEGEPSETPDEDTPPAQLAKRAVSVDLGLYFEEEDDLAVEKKADERFVLAVVLEPTDGAKGTGAKKPDAQKDIYSDTDVRKAAHYWAAAGMRPGLMHKEFIADKVRILETYLAPIAFKVKDAAGKLRSVRKGSWLMAFRVVDTKLWKAIRSGELTGLSVGGTAHREPESA